MNMPRIIRLVNALSILVIYGQDVIQGDILDKRLAAAQDASALIPGEIKVGTHLRPDIGNAPERERALGINRSMKTELGAEVADKTGQAHFRSRDLDGIKDV